MAPTLTEAAGPTERSSRISPIPVVSMAMGVAVIIAFALLGWRHRWMADDGFINLRVVQQLVAGNGPVFNAGERVEIATSPAWIALLLVSSRAMFFVRIEWVATLLALVLASAALAMAMIGATRLALGQGTRTVMFPAGMLVFVALPPAWDFATSGLESSLGLAWLSGSFCLLAGLATGRRSSPLIGAVLGFGPLVRPDFALYSAAFLLAFIALSLASRRSRGHVVACLAVASLAPVAYQVFRMAYYGALVPNTALAKEASLSNWDQGRFYLGDFAGTYAVWLPLALLALVVVVDRAAGWNRTGAIVVAASVLGGLAHWLYVVRVGGDFMHGRLLLPGLFSMLLPVAVVPLRRATVLSALVVPWAVAVALVARPDYRDGVFGPREIVNERRFYAMQAQRPNPVTIDDYEAFWAEYGRIARRASDAGERAVFLDEPSFGDRRHRLTPRASVSDVVVAFRYVGMLSFAAGPEVRVVDRLGLGDPIAGRLRLTVRGRPGHEKELDLAWVVARFAAPSAQAPFDVTFDAKVLAGRRAMRCGPLADVLQAVEEPLTPARMAENLRVAVTTRRLRLHHDPATAAIELCGRAGTP